jgi:hypothetical protein
MDSDWRSGGGSPEASERSSWVAFGPLTPGAVDHAAPMAARLEGDALARCRPHFIRLAMAARLPGDGVPETAMNAALAFIEGATHAMKSRLRSSLRWP